MKASIRLNTVSTFVGKIDLSLPLWLVVSGVEPEG